jgi:THO complex subunit 2
MASLTLPSLEALKKAAEDPSSDQCPTLVLQTLSYGTEAHEALEQRTAEASTVLTDVWTDFPSLEDAFVDSLWLCSSMLASSSSSKDAVKASTDALTAIVKNLVQVPHRANFWGKCQKNLDPSLLDASGLASETELLKKLRMHNTQLHYKQQKYNLLQEESEGYSKVLQFLTTGSGTDAVERRARLRQLIGTFELDPNRVLDLLVDILDLKLFPLGDELSSTKPEADAHVLWLLDMMKDFALDKLPALLTFKLAGDEKGVLRLLRTIAFLASENLLDLETMVTKYFPPIEDDVEKAHTKLRTKEKRRIQALGRVSLSGNAKEDPKLAELAEQLQQFLEPLEKSQALHLFLVLLEWGEWERVKPLLSLEVWGNLCRLLPTKFGFALCDVAHERILSWCKSKCPTPMLGKGIATDDSAMSEEYPDLTLDEVVQAVSDILLCTVQSSCISHRPILFCQLCRLVRSLLESEEAEVELSDATYKLFKTFLVPSLSLFPSNPAISTELWAVLKRLPYATRYRLYGDWTGAGLGKEGLVSSSSGKPLPNVESEMNAGKAVRYALKRLSKENIRDMSRQLAKVTHSNPIVVFATILGQIESYDNMVEVMVEATRFVNPLGLDVLGYCLLSRLSGMAGGVNRSRLKGMNNLTKNSSLIISSHTYRDSR